MLMFGGGRARSIDVAVLLAAAEGAGALHRVFGPGCAVVRVVLKEKRTNTVSLLLNPGGEREGGRG